MRWVFIVLMLASMVCAQQIIAEDEVVLLALTHNGSDSAGSVAKLHLELRPGTERVFLDTFPMTKVTTQASLRFAQQIACRETSIDCSNYDFLFKIEAMPGIVGGPSAGSAATLLTSALLLNKTVPSDVAMTGTINSGGTIGPVGGLKEKVEAAGQNGVKTVLLPQGTIEVNESNVSVNLTEFGKAMNLSVQEVATIGEVLKIALNVSLPKNTEPLVIDDQYATIMGEVAQELCERTEAYAERSSNVNASEAINFTRRAKESLETGAFYAAASFCFRTNVIYTREWYKEQNISNEDVIQRAGEILEDAKSMQEEVKRRNLSTISGLQTYMAVMERVEEAIRIVKEEQKAGENATPENIGYAEERLFSAKTWARFFALESREIKLDTEALQKSCASKIAEAEERYNYVRSLIPEALTETRKAIESAYKHLRSDEYVMCLYIASKAKAEADVLLSLMGVKESRFEEVIDLKIKISQSALVDAQKKNIFPIIAYSYYEYSKSLRDIDRVSSLLFAEYALELANVDLYFEDAFEEERKKEQSDAKPVLIAVLLAIGVIAFIVMIIVSYKNGSSRTRSKPKRAPKRSRGKKR